MSFEAVDDASIEQLNPRRKVRFEGDQLNVRWLVGDKVAQKVVEMKANFPLLLSHQSSNILSHLCEIVSLVVVLPQIQLTLQIGDLSSRPSCCYNNRSQAPSLSSFGSNRALRISR